MIHVSLRCLNYDSSINNSQFMVFILSIKKEGLLRLPITLWSTSLLMYQSLTLQGSYKRGT